MLCELTEKTYGLFEKARKSHDKAFDHFLKALKAAALDIAPDFARMDEAARGEVWGWAKREIRRTLPERGWTPRILSHYINKVEVHLRFGVPMDLVRTGILRDLVDTAMRAEGVERPDHAAIYREVREEKRAQRKARKKAEATLFRLPDGEADVDSPTLFREVCRVMADYLSTPIVKSRFRGNGQHAVAVREIRKMMRRYEAQS